MKVAITLSPRDYDVVLFDLDGVLAKTASVYAGARKILLNDAATSGATDRLIGLSA